MTSGDCVVAATRESKKTGQRSSKDIISEHEHASCVTHDCHLLQFNIVAHLTFSASVCGKVIFRICISL